MQLIVPNPPRRKTRRKARRKTARRSAPRRRRRTAAQRAATARMLAANRSARRPSRRRTRKSSGASSMAKRRRTTRRRRSPSRRMPLGLPSNTVPMVAGVSAGIIITPIVLDKLGQFLPASVQTGYPRAAVKAGIAGGTWLVLKRTPFKKYAGPIAIGMLVSAVMDAVNTARPGTASLSGGMGYIPGFPEPSGINALPSGSYTDDRMPSFNNEFLSDN